MIKPVSLRKKAIVNDPISIGNKMRLYTKDLPQLITKIQNRSILGLLLYGPDKGLIDYVSNQVKQALNLSARVVYYSNVANNLAACLSELSLFTSRDIVIVKDVPASLDKDGKNALEKDAHNFPILVADELSTNSSTRLFFEKSTHFASLSCYNDFAQDLKIIIRKYFHDKGKQITQEALQYICQNVNNDRGILYSELEKICLYCHDQKEVTFSIAQALILPSKALFSDKLASSLAKKDAQEYFTQLTDLLHSGVPYVLIARSLMRYYYNIYLVKQKMMCGYSLQDAIKTLSPPLLFMQVEDFKTSLEKLSNEQIIHTLSVLLNAEKRLKLESQNNHNVLENIFYQ